MTWDVEGTDEFAAWFASLDEPTREKVSATVTMLEELGPALGHPQSSQIKGSRHSRMRELRIQHKGDPYRVLYAFDPRRTAILLLGGSKAGDDRWYEQHVPRADDLYDEHLETIRREGLIDGNNSDQGKDEEVE